MGGGGREPYVALSAFCDMSKGAGLSVSDTVFCLKARYDSGFSNRKKELSGVAIPLFANGMYLNVSKEFNHGQLAGISRCLKADKHDAGVMIGLPDDGCAYAVWCEKYGCYVAVRRLTPRECFRLQGWEDVYFERAALVNSESQLYKQAGNGVTVPVVRAIAERMDIENEVYKKDCNGGGVPV